MTVGDRQPRRDPAPPGAGGELQWAIVADDLTGAADSASAFARVGSRAVIALSTDAVSKVADGGEVLVVATDSRDRDPDYARAVCGHVVDALAAREPRCWFKKVDSTLRGHLALELRLALARVGPALALVAPAFPATGRTVRAGRGYVHGVPLEESPVWRLQGMTGPADLPAMLAAGGLRSRLVPLDDVRSPNLAESIAALASSHDALVFDSEAMDDLAAVAAAGAAAGPPVLWVGSAGLAHALAAAQPSLPPPSLALPAADGPILVVVGSAAPEARRQFERLRTSGEIATERLSVDDLLSDPRHLRRQADRTLAGHLEPGHDLALGIDAPTRSQLDPPLARRVARALASCVAPHRKWVGGLVLTGGDTAHAVLAACGVHGLWMAGEVETGVPASVAAPHRLPIVTKAGAFGDDDTLRRAVAAIRRRHIGE